MPTFHLTLYLTSITQAAFLQMTIPLKLMNVYDMIVLASMIYISHHHTISYVHSWYHLHIYVLPDFAVWFRPEMFPTHPLSPAKPPSRQEIANLTQCLQDVAKRQAASVNL